MNSNNEKAVLITGASRGIGLAMLETFAKAGFTTYGTATSEKGAQSISNTLKELGNRGQGWVLNLAEPSSISKLIEQANQSCGSLWALINNAGITEDNLVLRMSAEQWSRVIQTNLTGTFQLTQGLIKPMLKKRQGRVINISSVVAFSGNAGQSNYCASKAGLIGLTKSMAYELGPRSITVNAIAPGFIQTDMTDELNDAHKQAIVSNTALKTFGNAQDIANGAYFLASEGAGYITGECLHINGGLYMA